MTGHRRYVRRGRSFLAFDFVAHGANRLRVRPDEDDASLGECLGEGFTLREKPVAGMHRFSAGRFAGVDDPVDDEIALRRRRRANQDRLIGHFDVKRIAIGFGIDRDCCDPHPPSGLDNAAGDLAAICDQNSLEHYCHACRPIGFAAAARKCQSTWTLAFWMTSLYAAPSCLTRAVNSAGVDGMVLTPPAAKRSFTS